MIRNALMVFTALLAITASVARGESEGEKITREHWFEIRTAHFNLYGCGTVQNAYKVATRLEQFRDAYSMLAGAQVVKSPPIVVMAFPDQESMEPFLPVYNGKPANLSGFFKRGSDENLIVLAINAAHSDSMTTIFHEYTHLLLRHNDSFWPLWLQEGMAEIHSTFEATGRGVKFGKPIEHHIRLLKHEPLMPLHELLAVTHDSPDYNEADRQGVFYAESWLLTHFLMNGDNAALKARFGNFIKLIKAGQPQEKAFTSALGMSLPAIEAELRRYLERGQFEPISAVVATDLSAPRPVLTRPLTQAETCYRLGNELMRIDRFDAAGPFFTEAEKLAPTSPLPPEGLGFLAAARENSAEAVSRLQEALRRGSTNFLAHYEYAEQRFRMTGDAEGRHARIDTKVAQELEAELKKSISLMPDFAPAHQLLGFIELVQEENLADAEEHLQRAVQLEPDNQWYLLPLAEAQIAMRKPEVARQTLAVLRTGHVQPKLRAAADQLLKEMDPPGRKPGN